MTIKPKPSIIYIQTFFEHLPISVRAKGAGGAAAPPEINFSGKMAKIYVIRKNFRAKFSGKEGPKFGQKFFGDVWRLLF